MLGLIGGLIGASSGYLQAKNQNKRRSKCTQCTNGGGFNLASPYMGYGFGKDNLHLQMH